jgi:N-acetylglucosamine kinase
MILCIDIGGTAIKGALAASPSAITPLERIATPVHDRSEFDAAIGRLIADNPTVAKVSISICGPVDPETDSVTTANIPCIDQRPLRRELGVKFSLPFLVANDADCFALAEATLGAGRGVKNVFGIILGTGIGGGVIVDGKIVSGAGGFAGEWGHGPIMPLMAGNPPQSVPQIKCGCGQTGCMDTLGGARGLERIHEHMHGVNLNSTEITKRWLGGDEAAAQTITLYLDLVSRPLALAVNILGAGIVPVGGGLSNVPELIAEIDLATRAKTLHKHDKPLVVPGLCTVEPGLVGAAIMGLAS